MIHHQDFLPLGDPIRKFKKFSSEKMKDIIDKAHLKTKERQNFTVEINGFILITMNFKYLGSWIYCNIIDSCYISSRITTLVKSCEI